MTGETCPNTRALAYHYDDGGRLAQVDDGTTTFANTFTYSPHGGLKSETWGNGAVHSTDYNRRLQASEVKLKQSSSGSELQRYNYSYGEVTQSSGSVDSSKNNGQIGRIDGFINGASTKEWDQRFVYDELGRLNTAAEYQQGTGSTPTWQTQYTFDRYGNRFQSGSGNSGIGYTSVTSGDIDAATNRFIASGSTPTTYDAAGNITTDTKFRSMNYSYDANGRMTYAYHTDSINNTDAQTSTYDCAGQRVQTSANGVTRTMVYDIFGQLVADYLGSNLERENIYRGGQLLAVYETGAGCSKSISSFVDAFYTGVNYTPSSTERSNAINALIQSQSQGEGQLTVAAQDLGNALFTSSNYSNSNSSEQYVRDLYRAYLDRDADAPGLAGWTYALDHGGSSRTDVRNGFAYSAEFQNDVGQVCPTTSSSSPGYKYVLSDLQGTTRAIMDNNSSSSAIVARHDYLPFGEEIWAGVGLRNASTQAYGATDGNRQKYGLTERDDASGLDHTPWRKLESFSGRWTSPDPYNGSMRIGDPQSFNRYSHVHNDPVNFIDPSGLSFFGSILRSIGRWLSNEGSGSSGGGEPFGGDTGIAVELGPDVGGDPGGNTTPNDFSTSLRSRLTSLLDKSKQCGDFLNALLAQLHTATDLDLRATTFLGVFDDIAKQGGYYDASGQIGDMGRTRVTPTQTRVGINMSLAKPGGDDSLEATIIHETTHGATKHGGGFNEFEIADAAWVIGRKMGLVPDGIGRGIDKKTDAANMYNKKLFDATVAAACGPYPKE